MIGNYHLIIKFGDVVVPLSTSILRELTIIQDLNKLLPEFRLCLDDASGLMTHIAPFDRNMSTVKIECALDSETEDKNDFGFLVYIREPGSNQSTPATDYDVTGFLDIEKLFAPDYSRGFSGTISSTLETIAGELGADSTEIDVSLNYEKLIVQPSWTNAQLINYLQDNLIGINGEYGYRGFMKVYKNKKIFMFKSLTKMITDPISYKFILNDTPYEDQLPVFEYYIYDNYNLYGIFGVRQQRYGYYDYENSEYVTGVKDIQDYTSLSDFFMVDKADPMDNNEMNETGRGNTFTPNFSTVAKTTYGNRLVNLVKMWITTQGLPNAVPGQTIQIFFPHGVANGDLYSYQYSGYWLVERVVHNLGDTFLTKLLLTRHGLDTDKKTSLLPATKKKKQ